MKATDFLECERPDKVCEAQGIKAMNNVELLAMVMNRGAVTLKGQQEARDLLLQSGQSLRALRRSSAESMQEVQGIGEYKSRAVMAALELANRLQEEEHSQAQLVEANAIYLHMQPLIGDLNHEEMWAILMNNDFRVLKTVRLSTGGKTETACDVRDLMALALKAGATVFALAHNHPSGSIRPSRADDNLTAEVVKASKVMRLRFVDHVIVTEKDYYSFQENGKI